MYKNQNGFSHIILLVLLLIMVGGVSVFVFNRVNKQANHQGMYEAKNYSVSFEASSDEQYVYQYEVEVYYDDSFDPASKCSNRLNDFKGALNIEYSSDSSANIAVLQNIKNHSKNKVSDEIALCTAVYIPPASERLRFDKEWIESGAANKTVLFNDKTYNLVLDKKNRTISLSGESLNKTQPYLPDGLAELFTYPMYENCMSLAQIQTYAQEQGIVVADSKYPGLTDKLKAIPGIRLEASDGSKNVLLVVADDRVKQLVEKTRNEKGVNNECRVAASKPHYTFVTP